MTTLTVIILHHHDLTRLEERLREVSQASQILVMDDPSEVSREVRKLQKKYSFELVSRKLSGDFARQRNAILALSKSQWTLFVDVDEAVSVELWHEIQLAIQSPVFSAYWIPRRDVFLGQPLRFGETGQMRLLRLAKTQEGRGKWSRSVHEIWSVPGPWGELKNPLLHFPHASISAFLQTLNAYAALEPGNRAPLSRRKVLFELFSYPPAKFLKAILWQQGWRDGVVGWIHAFLMSYYSLIVRVYCWEAWHVEKK